MRHLTREKLLHELARRPGLIPMQIDVDQRELLWIDLEGYHCYEGFFHKSLNRFTALKKSVAGKSPMESWTTGLDVLSDEEILVDSIYPAGFIFHGSRSGSTLLARIIARDRSHLVVSEAGAHNNIWQTLTDDGNHSPLPANENVRIYRNLLLAMGRRRRPEYRKYVIKFTSWNILFFNFIHTAFPEVPAIFLYREPASILASLERARPGWLNGKQPSFGKLLGSAGETKPGRADDLHMAAEMLTGFFAAALRSGKHGLRFLNYSQLAPANLPTILKSLNVSVTSKQLEVMRSQFAFHSKVEDRASKFLGGGSEESPQVTIEEGEMKKLQKLYHELNRSELNVVKDEISSQTTARW